MRKISTKEIVPYAAFVVSAVALCSVWLSPRPVRVDVFNSVVTVLSVLVTILIGWQVFQIINFRNERESLSNEFERMISHIRNEQTILSSSLFNYYMKQQKDYEVLIQGLDVIRLNLENKHFITPMFDALMEYSKDGFSFEFDYQLREAENLFISLRPHLINIVPAGDLELMRERIGRGRS